MDINPVYAHELHRVGALHRSLSLVYAFPKIHAPHISQVLYIKALALYVIAAI
jgi:hypothetical protein